MRETNEEMILRVVKEREERQAAEVRLGIAGLEGEARAKKVAEIQASINGSNPADPALPPRDIAPEVLAKMTTSEKIAAGLKASAASSQFRGTIVTHTGGDAGEKARNAREQRMALSDQGMSRASLNLMKGLVESQAARPTTKPAA